MKPNRCKSGSLAEAVAPGLRLGGLLLRFFHTLLLRRHGADGIGPRRDAPGLNRLRFAPAGGAARRPALSRHLR